MSIYSLSDFDYHLPEELIAQSPTSPRDHARLLVYNRATKTIADDVFYNLGKYLPAQSTLVVNNSKVEKCRLLFNDGRMELFVTNTRNDTTIEALVRPGKKFKVGKTITLENGVEARTTHVTEDGLRTIQLSHDLDDPIYESFKHTPFPPYIKQDESLAGEYQTVYAKDLGSKAAPTAGLHFTDDLLSTLKQNGIQKAEVTLHVGLGTFAPVKSDDISEHIMHSEWYQLDHDTAQILNKASHITAVGTTSVRVLESAKQPNEPFQASSGDTDIFITPGYTYKAVDALITNFHLPKSTLLMLVSALMGFNEMHRVYQHAIEQRYRFYSFGDAMLIV